MTISNPSSQSGPFTPDGAAVTFPFDFFTPSSSELEVVSGDPGGVQTILSGWTAILNGEGGSVTFAAPPAVGSGPIYIYGDPDFTQSVTGDAVLYPDTVTRAFDRLTAQNLALLRMVQALASKVTPEQLTAAALQALGGLNLSGLDTGTGA